MSQSLVEKAIHWLFFALTIIYALTGLGITQYQTIEAATLGLLTKNLSFRIHDSLLLPFIVLLLLHVMIKPIKRIYTKLAQYL